MNDTTSTDQLFLEIAKRHMPSVEKRWLGKLGQPDKWISCLTAAILPPTRREHDGANPPDA